MRSEYWPPTGHLRESRIASRCGALARNAERVRDISLCSDGPGGD